MPNCEMCGYQGSNLSRAIVEGTMLLLCDKCVKFGEVIEIKKPSDSIVDQRLSMTRTSRFASRSLAGFTQEDEVIVRNYAELIRKERERMGKTQEDVAKDLAEKVSVIQKIESGNYEPPLNLAKKLAQYFRINLIRKLEFPLEDEEKSSVSTGGPFTIGDVIKIKK